MIDEALKFCREGGKEREGAMAARASPSQAESEEEEEADWEDWEDADVEGGDGEEAVCCLFCDGRWPSPELVLRHCAETHAFDFRKLRAEFGMGFYETLRFINYIRSQVAASTCWKCGSNHETREALLDHLDRATHPGLFVEEVDRSGEHGQQSISYPKKTSKVPWADDKFLTPFLENDPLLYSFEGEGDYQESEEFDILDKSTAIRELLEGTSITKDSVGRDGEIGPEAGQTQGLVGADLVTLTEAFQALGDGLREELANPAASPALSQTLCSGVREGGHSSGNGLGSGCRTSRVDSDVDPVLASNGSHEVASQPSGDVKTMTKRDRKLKVSFSNVAEGEVRNINSDYFGSYSGFGIHREMLGDKVRTDSYRSAITDNPSLFKDAVVMDVGCGTGILSLFAAQAGASRVIAVDGSAKMASVARQVAKVNGYLHDGAEPVGKSSARGVLTVVAGMIEDLDTTMPASVQGVDVLVSEWMGYCLLFESMLGSVLHARDRWLKPGGAMLPDTAHMYVAGFGKGGTSLPFWENVYGFDMSCVGEEVVHDATQSPIVDVVDPKEVVTNSCHIKAFDLVTMKHEDVDFTSQFQLDLPTTLEQSYSKEDNTLTKTTEPGDLHTRVSESTETPVWCYGLVVWFDTEFTDRFCKEKPVLLTTSPHAPRTHWSQTLLTFREPIALCKKAHTLEKVDRDRIGTIVAPATAVSGRISVARSSRHRSIDISLETSALAAGGLVRNWPVQMFDI